jgi:hypothetical protein
MGRRAAALDLPLAIVVGHVLNLHRRGVTVVLTLDPARVHRFHPDRAIPDGDLRQQLVGWPRRRRCCALGVSPGGSPPASTERQGRQLAGSEH